MELAKIEQLLEKYWKAETSLEEEKILQAYFSSDKVAEHLIKYKPLFQYYIVSKSDKTKIDIQLETIRTKKNFYWISAAASVVVVFGLFFGKQEYDKYQQRKQFAQVKKALEMVSFNLNKGNDAIYAVSDNLSKGSDAVTKLETYDKAVQTVLNKINY